MPRTRNVSRSQWDEANSMNENKPKASGYDSEKENASRVPRTRARTAGRAVLGAVPTTTNTRTTGPKSKGKGKGDPKPKRTVTKVEKLPFEDITSRYLPAPESQNRGHAQPGGFGEPEANIFSPVAGPSTRFSWTADNTAPLAHPIQRPTFPSSLPPSSPPSASPIPAPSQAQLPTFSRSPTPLDNVARRLFADAPPHPVYDAWDEFDRVIPESEGAASHHDTPRNSDPFGFFALERKLKVEREERREEDEAGGLLLVKDGSPQPSKSNMILPGFGYDDEIPDDQGVSNEGSPILPPTPPTPHKKRVRNQTRSPCGIAEDEHIFSPRSSSCPSSPSPSKPHQSSGKRKQVEADFDEVHEEVGDGTPLQQQRTMSRKKRVKAGPQPEEGHPLRRSQRGRPPQEQENDDPDVQLGPSRRSRSKKVSKKLPRTAATKKERASKPKKAAIQPVEDSDAEEKREQERQARIEYFRKLDEYEVETENVYVI